MNNWLVKLADQIPSNQGQVNEIKSAVGDLDVEQLQQLINTPAPVATPHLNEFAEKVAAYENMGRSLAREKGEEIEKTAFIGALGSIGSKAMGMGTKALGTMAKNPTLSMAGAGALGGAMMGGRDANGQTHRFRNALMGAGLGAAASKIPLGKGQNVGGWLGGQMNRGATTMQNWGMPKTAGMMGNALTSAGNLVKSNPRLAAGAGGALAGGAAGALTTPTAQPGQAKPSMLGRALGGAALGAGAGVGGMALAGKLKAAPKLTGQVPASVSPLAAAKAVPHVPGNASSTLSMLDNTMGKVASTVALIKVAVAKEYGLPFELAGIVKVADDSGAGMAAVGGGVAGAGAAVGVGRMLQRRQAARTAPAPTTPPAPAPAVAAPTQSALRAGPPSVGNQQMPRLNMQGSSKQYTPFIRGSEVSEFSPAYRGPSTMAHAATEARLPSVVSRMAPGIKPAGGSVVTNVAKKVLRAAT